MDYGLSLFVADVCDSVRVLITGSVVGTLQIRKKEERRGEREERRGINHQQPSPS